MVLQMLDQSLSYKFRSETFAPMKLIHCSSVETDVDQLHKRNSTFSVNQLQDWNYSSSTVNSVHLDSVPCKQNNYGYVSLYGPNTPRKPERRNVTLPGPFKFHAMPLPPIPNGFLGSEKFKVNIRSYQTYHLRVSLMTGFVRRQRKLESEINLFLTESEALSLRKETFWVHLKPKFKQVPRFINECNRVCSIVAFQYSLSLYLCELGKVFLSASFSPIRICRFDVDFEEIRDGHEFSMFLVATLDCSYSKLKGEMISLKDTSALYRSATKRVYTIETQTTKMLKRYGYNSKVGSNHIIPLLNFFEDCKHVFMETSFACSFQEWADFFSEVDVTFNSAEEVYRKIKQLQAASVRLFETSVQMKKRLRQTIRNPEQLY